MSDNDTDALLKDLESRAGKSSSAAAASGGDDEDIEAFLRSLEGDDYVAPKAEPEKAAKKTATKAADPLDDKFAKLEAAPDAPMQKAPAKAEKNEPEKKSFAEKRAEKKAAKEAEKEAKAAEKETAVAKADGGDKGDGVRKAARFAKWAVVLLPLATAWWVLGAFLSNWVSAGWLVFLLATTVVFALPFAALRGVKKGRYVWWTAGTSALMAGILIGALPVPSANALASYGHWPMSAVAEVAGLKTDSALMRGNAAFGAWIGDWINPQKEDDPEKRFPRKLGGDDPLNPEDAPKDPNAPDPNAPNPTPNPNNGQPQPQPDPNAQPQPPQPDPNAQPQPPQPQPQPDPNVQPQPPQPQPQPDPNAQPQPPQPDPNAQPQPQPQPPQPQPQPQPQPDPNTQPPPQPQPDPNAPQPETP